MAASKRCLPTNLYWDPLFSELNSDAQSVLIGLTLDADDHGRGLAWEGRLARVLNKSVSVITTALDALEAISFIRRYEVDGVPYYHHEKWDKWQRLDNRARSQYPDPPQSSENHGDSRRTSESPGDSPLEGEVEGGRGKKNKNLEVEAEGEDERRTAKVIPLPTHSGGGGADVLDGKRVDHVTAQVAAILKLPNDAALRRVVADFLPDPTLSLLGEADAAREYIDNPQRNHRHKVMSPTFYRQWLKRERDQTKATPSTRTGTDGASSESRPKPQGLASRNLNGLAAQYQRDTEKPDKGGAHG